VLRRVVVQGKDLDAVVMKYLMEEKIAFEALTLPSKKFAQLVIPDFGGEFTSENGKEGPVGEASIGFSSYENSTVALVINEILSQRGASRMSSSLISQN